MQDRRLSKPAPRATIATDDEDDEEDDEDDDEDDEDDEVGDKTTGDPLSSSHTKTTGDPLLLPCQDDR